MEKTNFFLLPNRGKYLRSEFSHSKITKTVSRSDEVRKKKLYWAIIVETSETYCIDSK